MTHQFASWHDLASAFMTYLEDHRRLEAKVRSLEGEANRSRNPTECQPCRPDVCGYQTLANLLKSAESRAKDAEAHLDDDGGPLGRARHQVASLETQITALAMKLEIAERARDGWRSDRSREAENAKHWRAKYDLSQASQSAMAHDLHGTIEGLEEKLRDSERDAGRALEARNEAEGVVLRIAEALGFTRERPFVVQAQQLAVTVANLRSRLP